MLKQRESTEITNVRSTVLNKADSIVNGHREEEYGSPENNFAVIAKLWTDYLGGKTTIDGTDVAMMMALLKIARIRTGTAKMDSFIDLAGYAACGAEAAVSNA